MTASEKSQQHAERGEAFAQFITAAASRNAQTHALLSSLADPTDTDTDTDSTQGDPS